MADPLSTTPPPAPNPPPMAGPGAGSAPANPPPIIAAAVSAPLFGGFRGGRARKDGLRPGSPEAIEADRKKDRDRKANHRSVVAAANPPPLPSAAPGAVAAPMPGLGSEPVPGGVAPDVVVPWDQQTLKPLFDQLLPTLEQLGVSQLAGRATKARLSREVVTEIEKDAKWSPPARKALEIAAPQVAAKWLNSSGISAEHQPEIVLGTALASILTSHVLLLRKLDKLIAENVTAPAAKPAEEKKP